MLVLDQVDKLTHQVDDVTTDQLLEIYFVNLTDERDYKPKSSPKDILNMLENLTKQMDGKARMRYGFF